MLYQLMVKMVKLLLNDFYKNNKKNLFKNNYLKDIYFSTGNVGSRSNVKKLFNDLSNGCHPILFENKKF